MSEGDVSLIHDEDVLRRMWQQTEDFSRKKEIRAHMYKLREERLKQLYSPEPQRKAGSLVCALQDEGFSRAKRREVRGASSPPPHQAVSELKPLSNAGWNVQSESSTEDGGATHVRTVRADIQGAYDVEGGKGQFAARDTQRKAVTERHDDNSSYKKSEQSAATASEDHMVQKTADGATVTATKQHQSTVKQVSSTSRVVKDDGISQQSLRQTEGELVSRRVEHPDANTTVVVETRELPDGSRVTSTRRQFRDTVQSQRSEYQAHQARSETRSSSTIRSDSHSTRNIVDSQRQVDDHDFKSNHAKYLTQDDSSQTQQTSKTIDSRESKSKTTREVAQDVSDYKKKEEYSSRKNVNDNYSSIDRRSQRHDATYDETAQTRDLNQRAVDEVDRGRLIRQHDDVTKESRRVTDAKLTKNVEEVVEKSTDQYQTTYQSDYSQKKVSSDWSPTHQAWASTLRGDSPDKGRRSCSPNKADRGSPARSGYSYSTHSVASSDRYTSPDRRSHSPEKRFSASPDRKPYQASPNAGLPQTSTPYRQSSPAKRPAPSATSPSGPESTPGYMRPTRASLSPTKQSFNTKDHYKFIDEETKMYSRSDHQDVRYPRGSTPDSDRPTVSDHTDRSSSPSILRKTSRSPSPPKGPVSFTQDNTDKYQSTKKDFSSTYDYSENTASKQTSLEKGTQRTPSPTKYGTYEKQKSPLKERPSRDRQPADKPSPRSSVSPDHVPGYMKSTISSKHHESTTESNFDYETSEIEEARTSKTEKRQTEDITKSTTKDHTRTEKSDSLTRHEKTNRTNVSPDMSPDSPRDSSPSKYGTYDKKKQRNEQVEQSQSVTTKNTTDVQYDSLTRGLKSDVPKQDSRPSPAKNTKSSTSPTKSHIKDAKHKHTSDFINTERTFEEINKKTRQLVTPSSSPTRKPKNVEPTPSTGQSSPTTSVSGFIYYGSPTIERKTIVTDLDDDFFESKNTTEETTTLFTRPASLDLKRSPSPSKIPCRSPSPPKKASPVKETLPRKSSLKKPPTLTSLTSPVEKPPTTFQISPTTETQPEHKVVKKDRADKPTEADMKTKPTLERRETYTERCLKILGVLNDNNTTVAKNELFIRSNSSPRIGADPKSAPLNKKLKTTEHVTDFIRREQEDTRKKITTDGKSKTPSRDNSPTKLQDIMSIKTTSSVKETTETRQNSQSTNVRQETDRETGYQQPKDGSTKPVTSPTRSSKSPEKKSPQSPVRAGQSPERKPSYKQPQASDSKPMRSSVSPDRKPGFMKTSVAATTKVNATTEEVCKEFSTSTIRESTDAETGYQTSKESTPIRFSASPPRKGAQPSSVLERPSSERLPADRLSSRSSVSPDRELGYMKSTISSKLHESVTDSNIEAADIEEIRTSRQPSTLKTEEFNKSRSPSPSKTIGKLPHEDTSRLSSVPVCSSPDIKPTDNSTRASISPERELGYLKSTISSKLHESVTDESHFDSESTEVQESRTSRQPSQPKAEEPKHSRTPSPAKSTSMLTHDVTEFIQSEREKEILDRVQTSLRKLSPSREQKSPIREKSPTKSTISLEDIDIVAKETAQTKNNKKVETKTQTETASQIAKETRKSKDDKIQQKSIISSPSRTVSPTKKPTGPTSAKTPESPTKTRSTSPKKTVERPQSPQVPRQSGIKPRESTPSFIRKPSKIDVATSNLESIQDDKKSTVSKQSSFTKTSTFKSVASKFMNRAEPETKRMPAPKENKENVSPKKDETKVTRTTSDHNIKAKKPSPQRMKSKPEIQVNDSTPTKALSPTKKPATKSVQTKLAPKPKSATALNTPNDDDDIIIDVEQAKSSRENSPDRRSICPTPVGFSEDVGTPRLPDEVKEPDDEFVRRTHHTIHETESLVDDIIEISEDEELQQTTTDRINQSDECLLSVTDKVSKFTNKIESVTKPQDSTTIFKDTERRVDSDFVDEKLKSDACLLTVSEKVNKFAKGPRDMKSPVRNITSEYDTETVYQDDFTKLSVNNKAHLFVETAENSKVTKSKPVQKVERPDFTDVEESLRSDDCLLSVSDKVNKFVKTAEQFLNETTHESRDTEKLIKERYEKFMKQLQEEEVETKQSVVNEDIQDRKTTDVPSFAKETTSSHNKVRDSVSPHIKQAPTEKTPIGKITALRSSEAVKKAKALFENIATTQSTKDTNSTKLLDIGVIKKSPKTDSTIALHPSDEESPNVTDSEVDGKAPSRTCNGTARFNDSLPTSEATRTKSPVRKTVDTTTKTVTKSVLSRFPAAKNEQTIPIDTPKHIPKQPTNDKQSELIKSHERVSQNSITRETKEERTQKVEDVEVSTRRGSGKFGVELRRTSLEKGERRASADQRRSSADQRRLSADRPQPTVEDIYDVDLLEQMLEKVVGYEQRRRIRCQIRIAKKKIEEQKVSHTYTKTKHISAAKSPERRPFAKSPERKTPKAASPDRAKAGRLRAAEVSKPLINGHSKESGSERQRTVSPDKVKSSVNRRVRPASPSKTPKATTNRFSEYASAYMKKIGLADEKSIKANIVEKTAKVADDKFIKTNIIENSAKAENVKSVTEDNTSQLEHKTVETKTSTSSKTSSFTERKSSKETMEVKMNGKRSPSPEKRPVSQGRLYQRSPSPDFKRRPQSIPEVHQSQPKVHQTQPKVHQTQPKVHQQRETVVQTVRTSETVSGDKPTWATTRNLKKVSAESSPILSRSSAPSSPRPARSGGSGGSGGVTGGEVVGVEAITSGYGPGPLDADGRPLFGIKALRNNSVRSSTVTQTQSSSSMQWSSESESGSGGPAVGVGLGTEEELSRLLREPAARPARLHGLAAITASAREHNQTQQTQQTQSQPPKQSAAPSSPRPARHAGPVRQGSVKSLTEKYTHSATKTDTVAAGNARRPSPMEEPSVVTTITTSVSRSGSGGRQERSFLDSSTKVTGVQDILARMKNADIVIESGDTVEDSEARALLNKFLGATVLMAGMQSYVTDTAATQQGVSTRMHQEIVSSGVRSHSSSTGRAGQGSQVRSQDIDLDHCWDEQLLKQLLEQCGDYEQRRRIRTRLRALMAEQDACAAVAEAVAAVEAGAEGDGDGDENGEEETRDGEETEVTVSARRGSSESTNTTTTTTTTKTSKVVESMTRPAPKSVSPFAKFRQLEKQNSTSSQNSTPQSPCSPGQGQGQGPLFKFTDPALHASALTIKERLLQWCRDKTRDYENVKLENFSTSWADGMAFCALLHHFLPDAFDYSALEPQHRRHNFTLAFKVADEKAGIYPLLDVDDMVAMRKPDWKCVFTYVQAIHRRFKDQV